MNRGVIVAPARTLAEIANQWDLLDGKEQRSMAEFRAAKTKLLIEARQDPKWGARGDGFVEFVEKRLKLSSSTAFRWMTDAGWKPPKTAGAGRKEDIHSQIGNESAASIVKQSTPKKPALADDEPLPAAERQELVERLDREAEERRQAALTPLRMESRETAESRYLAWLESSIGGYNALVADGVHMNDCTASDVGLDAVKTRALTLFGILESELTRVDVNTVRPVAPKNQLSLLTGGKKE